MNTSLKYLTILKPALMFLLISAYAQAVLAAQLSVSVSDAKGNKMKDVVVFLEPQFEIKNAHKPVDKLIDQRDKEFIPYVTAVQAGTSIRFPNNDRIRHHVYSFSRSKSFEIPLYKDVEPKPVLFAKPGVVPLGCNIHDWMKAYVFVSKTPYFAVTDANGKVQISDLPVGKYLAKLYHPRLKNWQQQQGKSVQLDDQNKRAALDMKMGQMKKVFSAFRPPTGFGASAYR